MLVVNRHYYDSCLDFNNDIKKNKINYIHLSLDFRFMFKARYKLGKHVLYDNIVIH